MKCYYAPSEDAIGVCKCCGRGLSHEFAVDLRKGLACKGRCEEDVKALIGLVERNIAASVRADEILRRSAGTSIWSSVFSVITGAFFVGFGILKHLPPEWGQYLSYTALPRCSVRGVSRSWLSDEMNNAMCV
jgi:hypothetical protein